ncbi:XRE family transcriptional regulator [Pelagibacterium sp.]|uniref:XRE family transcriptional regulator n=1 Tax=Pelagibacterium sp. TaxID=1967288 RepID=UPI003A942963
MKTLGARIAHYRNRAGMSQAGLAKACKWASQSRVGNYEKDTREPSLDDIALMADVLRIPKEWLLLGEGGQFDADDASNVEQGPPIVSPYRAIPIVGTAQMGAEGYWYALEEADGTVDAYSRDASAYALRLKGDSMAPAIRSGWIAVCEPNGRLVPGEYVMIRLRDGESMLKLLGYANDVEVGVLSVNPAYDMRTIAFDDIEHIHFVGAIVPPSKVRL